MEKTNRGVREKLNVLFKEEVYLFFQTSLTSEKIRKKKTVLSIWANIGQALL